MIDFFSWNEPKFFTLAAIAILLLALPILMKRIEQKLSGDQAPLYRKYAVDNYVQIALMLLPVFLAAYHGFKSNNLTIVITNAFLSICLFGGLASLWNARKAWIELTNAKKISTNNGRLIQLHYIALTTKIIIYTAVFSAALGLLGLIYVNMSKTQPNWFWFLAFMFTAYPITLRTGSNSALIVASKYASDKKFGEENRAK